MYVCTYVRTYACTYVRMYVCTFVCTYVRLYLRTYVGTYVCSAISSCTTTVRPHEPSSRHIRRLHVKLTTGRVFSRLFSCLPCARDVRVNRRHETSPSPRSSDIRPTIVQPTSSSSLRSNETRTACGFSWR